MVMLVIVSLVGRNTEISTIKIIRITTRVKLRYTGRESMRSLTTSKNPLNVLFVEKIDIIV
jgi:hypothetical protein